ncbi:hypothetical protein HDV06_005271 [Boothiomyces sp. JEL0866]|nr:hypothetical protein HDV06_005271 [Boothiomyces sp. JEL0866]
MEEFEREINSLGDKIPVSVSKITNLTKIAHRNPPLDITNLIEKFIRTCPPPVKLGVVYLIDSIFKAKKTEYPKIIGPRLLDWFTILSQCPDNDKEKMKRVLNLWMQNELLASIDLKKILECFIPKPVEKIKEQVPTPQVIQQPLAGSPLSLGINLFGKSDEVGLGGQSLLGGISGLSSLLSSVKPNALGLGNMSNETIGLSNLIGMLGGKEPPKLIKTEADRDPRNERQDSRDRYDRDPRDRNSDQKDRYQQDARGFDRDPRNNSRGYDSRNDRNQDNRQTYQDSRGHDDRQDSRGYNDRQDPRGYNDRNQDPRGYNDRNQDPRGHKDRNQDPRGYNDRNQEPRQNQPYTGQQFGQMGNPQDMNQYHQLMQAQFQQPFGFNQLPPNLQLQNQLLGQVQNQSPPYTQSPTYPSNSNQFQNQYQQQSNQKTQSRSNSVELKPKKQDSLQLGPGPDCVPSHPDPSVPQDCIKYWSRTLYISEVPPSVNQTQLQQILERVGRVETIRVNSNKKNSFVKIATRKEAEMIRSQLQAYHVDGHNLKIGWGCGYGPREHFNYTEGFTLFPISKIPINDQPYIASSPRGGGPIIGGTVCEEPNVPMENVLNARGNASAPREGLPLPPRLEKQYKRQSSDYQDEPRKRRN